MIAFLQQYITTVIAALVIMGTAFSIFWVAFGKKLSNRKIQLSKRAGWPQIKEEIVTTIISFFGSSIFTVFLLALKDKGMLKFYIEPSAYGTGYLIFTVVTMVLISDGWFYWSHRIMHHPKIYKYVHALHHRSLDVNPFTSTSFHVIESLWLTVWMLPLAYFMPISMTALGIMQVLGTLNNLKSHLGYELFPGFFNKAPFNFLVTATNHSLHHTQYNGNYGLFFRFWDIVCKTELNTTAKTFEEIHHRKNEVIIDNTKYQTLTISDLVKENENTISVYFKPSNNLFYNYKPGQYLTIRVKAKGKTHSRCFSISSCPQKDNFLRITVKLKGDVSHYFYNEAKVGDTIESLLPVGDFILENNETPTHYTMIAGGSGITPLYSMINYLLEYTPQHKITLLYANKDESSIIFNKEIQALAQKHPQFHCINFLSGGKKITADALKSTKETQYYICGPESLKQSIQNELRGMQVPESKIHIEQFADGYVPWFGLF
jgi:ring-1,2-phenylacetyl-CoA epoxidase subunit PaaE